MQLLRFALRAIFPFCHRNATNSDARWLLGIAEQVIHAVNRIGFLSGKQVPISVHCQDNARMPHHLLNDIRLCARECQPSTAGMPQGVEVNNRPVVTFRQ